MVKKKIYMHGPIHELGKVEENFLYNELIKGNSDKTQIDESWIVSSESVKNLPQSVIEVQ